MMGLVDNHGDAFSLADIASIQNRPGSPGNAERYIVNKLSGRGTSLLFTHEYDELMARPVQLTTAPPGTYLLRSYVDDEGAHLDALPILAWAICVDGQTRAMLPDGVNSRRGTFSSPDFIRMPDGGIYEFGYEAEPDRFVDEDAVPAHLRNEHVKRRARDAADAAAREQAA